MGNKPTLARWMIFLGSVIGGCQTIPQIETSSPAQIATLDPEFQVTSRLGPAPTLIDKTIPVQRMAIYSKGRSPEYLVIVTPALVKGTLKFPIQESKDVVESAVEYNRYLDLLMRAHRLILRGEIDEGEKTLEKLEGLFDKTYASLILRSNIAVLRGDSVRAGHYMQQAYQLYPEASVFTGKDSKQ